MLKFEKGVGMAEVEDKDKLVFEVDMPQYTEKGKEISKIIAYREATM